LERPSYPKSDDPSASIIAILSSQKGAIILEKTTVGTLSSTDLHTNLQERGIHSVIVYGVATDICVGQTARQLANRGYEVGRSLANNRAGYAIVSPCSSSVTHITHFA
jgi:nicotinamidase-related amidase